MKKKLLAILLCGVMVFSLAACGSSSSSDDTDETEEETEAEEEEEEADSSDTVSSSDYASADTDGDGELSDEELIAYCSDGMETEIECEAIELSLACSGTVDGTVMGDAIEYGIELLSEWTDGNFVITFYPGGELGGDTELIEGVQMGSIDIFTGAPSSQNGLIPETAVLDICGLYEDIDTCNAVLKSFQDELNTYYNEKGLELLTLYAPDVRILTTNKAIESADDLQNLTIRTQENSYHMTFWSALGSNPTPLAFGELYIALQQGTVDAQENPWASIYGAKLYEVQEYITLTNHVPFMSTYVTNQSTYESLSDEQRLALDQFIQFVETYQLAGTDQDDARMMEECIEYGCTVSEVSDDIKELCLDAAQEVIDDLKEELDADYVQSYVDATGAYD